MKARNIRGLWPGTGVEGVGSGRFWAYIKVELSGSPAGEDVAAPERSEPESLVQTPGRTELPFTNWEKAAGGMG